MRSSIAGESSHIESTAGTALGVPAWTHAASTAGCVKTQPGNHHENMTTLGIHGYPFAKTRTPPAQEVAGDGLSALAQHACLAQHKSHTSGAIVGRVMMPTVSATETIRTTHNFVGRHDGFLDPFRSMTGNGGPAAGQQTRGVARPVHVLGRACGSTLSVALLLASGEQQDEKQSFLVRFRDKLIPVTQSEIAFCYTSEEKVYAYGYNGERYPMEYTLEALQGMLSQKRFYRANRQFIIARQAVVDVSVWFGSRLSVNLKVDIPEKIIVPKARVPEFKQWLKIGQE